MPCPGDAGNGLKKFLLLLQAVRNSVLVVGFAEQFAEKLHHDSSKIVLGLVQKNQAFIFSCFVNCTGGAGKGNS